MPVEAKVAVVTMALAVSIWTWDRISRPERIVPETPATVRCVCP